MNTSEVIRELAKRLDKPQSEIQRQLTSVVDVFRKFLSENTRFMIPNFGTFDTEERKTRKAFNPHYKKMMVIPAKIVGVFRPAKALKDETNR